MTLMLRATDYEDHNTVEGKYLNTRIELKNGTSFRVEAFSANRGGLYVVLGRNDIPPLSRPLLCTYHCFHITRFYKKGLVKIESTLAL